MLNSDSIIRYLLVVLMLAICPKYGLSDTVHFKVFFYLNTPIIMCEVIFKNMVALF